MGRLFTYPLTDLSDCATGHHDRRPTRRVGDAICVTCGTIGYCRYCAPGDIPPGAPLRPCRIHRHSPIPLVDSARPLSAFTRDNHIYTLNGMISSEAKPVVLLSIAKDVHTGRMDLVIDQDLGHSAASTADRLGFQRLVASVGLGQVGLVKGLGSFSART